MKTLSSFYSSIENDYSWRIKELSNFKSSIIIAKGKHKEGMIRAGVTLLYAHWEGFVKKSADSYYNFVINQNYTLADFNNSFISIALRSNLENLVNSKKLTIHNEIIDSFFNKTTENPHFSKTSPIKTSNLKYEIFEDVCILIGIDINELHLRYKRTFDRNIELIINEDLVGRRNKIAHGNYLDIDEKEFKKLYDIIVNGLLFNFKELLIDCAQNKKYLNGK